MYTLEGVSGVANFITAYKESINRDSHFLIWSVLCFQRQSFWRLFYIESSKRLTSIVHILSHENDNYILESGKGENSRRKYFMINLLEKCCGLGGGRIHYLLITSQTRIQLSHRGRQGYHWYSLVYEQNPPILEWVFSVLIG